jgi:predicted alpha/beta hydrolase
MAETLTLTVHSNDYHRFKATVYTGADENAPILIFQSALGTPAKVYRHFSAEMAKHGIQVCTPDWRGIDSSSVRAGRSSDFGYRHLVEVDLPALIAAVRQRFPHSPIWLGGHSLGGQLALLGAAANSETICAVVLIASGTVHLPCYQGKLRWGVRFLTTLSAVVNPVLGYFPGARIGCGGREAAGLMRDWSHVARTGEYRPIGSELDYEALMRSLSIPVLAITFAADSWSPALAAKGLLIKVPNCAQTHWTWSAADTAGVPVDHYSWLKQPDLVVPAVAKYLHVEQR